ncbi:hypothetical protein BH10PSE15_BH10PSE15_00800 [soil metagenome]
MAAEIAALAAAGLVAGAPNRPIDVAGRFSNPVIGYLSIWHVGALALRDAADVGAPGPGALRLSLFAVRHFGRFNGGNMPQRT